MPDPHETGDADPAGTAGDPVDDLGRGLVHRIGLAERETERRLQPGEGRNLGVSLTDHVRVDPGGMSGPDVDPEMRDLEPETVAHGLHRPLEAQYADRAGAAVNEAIEAVTAT